jgi:hypothetical protein
LMIRKHRENVSNWQTDEITNNKINLIQRSLLNNINYSIERKIVHNLIEPDKIKSRDDYIFCKREIYNVYNKFLLVYGKTINKEDIKFIKNDIINWLLYLDSYLIRNKSMNSIKKYADINYKEYMLNLFYCIKSINKILKY